jgi:deoxyribonuclease-4
MANIHQQSSSVLLGCHVSMKAPRFLLGALEEALAYQARVMMIYLGAPQNSSRKPIEALKITDFREKLEQESFSLQNVFVHAPYIVNMANFTDEAKKQFTQQFLLREVLACEALNISVFILHPGNYLKQSIPKSLNQIANTLNFLLSKTKFVKFALETMSGKGSELGVTFEEIATIMEQINVPERVGVCWDTCHMHNAGYDFNNLDKIIDEFDHKIGLSKL